MRPFLMLALVLTALACSAGCFGGSHSANVELRREREALDARITKLEGENQQLRSDVRRLESSEEVLPTLPEDRLAQLWTVAGIRFGRLTGIDRRAEGQPLKVFLKPVDDEGSTLKAAGRIVIEAFDLESENVRLGRWEFAQPEARKMWTSVGILNEYVLTCPWEAEAPAEGRKLLVKATFEDALTQRRFDAHRDAE